ncbi:DUF5786 family protein [Halalkalicoccus ordinarius]|uniref:DUF5786 family protein n=1 Tax=Halalkalicoccus ordinarius TaxID=3116651 RepID=UPI00300F79DC
MGTFDHQEYERRERMISSIDTRPNDRRPNYEGRIEYVNESSVDALLARLKELKALRESGETRNPI